jgi:hypothetical protein
MTAFDFGRTDPFEIREPRCRICRDEDLRLCVNELLVWHGAPTFTGPRRAHVVTYVDILRHLNENRATADQISYSTLWVHAKKHYGHVVTAAEFRAWMYEEIIRALDVPRTGSTSRETPV